MSPEPTATAPSSQARHKSRLNAKTFIIRLALLWLFLGQMLFVCLPASTTWTLSRLESTYAAKPSAANKAALDSEFDRVADYESHRAIGRFALLLAADVALIAFCWNLGTKRKAAQAPVGLPGVAPANAV